MLSHLIDAFGDRLGWLAVAAAGVAVVAYCLGCFNGAVVVSRYILRDDVRNHGSGNAGLTNFHRVFGGPLTAVVILSDVVKAVLAVMFAVFIAVHISPDLVPLAKYWAGTFCLLGHMYPCTFQFRGGKGILSGGTIAIMMGFDSGNPYSWCIPVVVWGGFLILAVATRYVSLGSCWAGFSFPFVSWFVYRDSLTLLLAVIVGGLILWKHRGNIVRLIKGTESKFTLHKKPAGEAGGAVEAQQPAVEPPAEAEPAVPEQTAEEPPVEAADESSVETAEDALAEREAPADDIPAVEETLAEESPGQEPSAVEEVPVEEPPAAEPAEEKPAEEPAEKPAVKPNKKRRRKSSKKPAQEKSAERATAGEDKP